jgi:hypothetical protein
MRPVQLIATVAFLAIGAITASAQPIVSAKSGVVASVEGKVLIDGTEVQESATHFPDVKEGAILRTEEGRAELMLPPGFMLRLGEHSSLKMVTNRLIDTSVEMQAGSAVVEVDQPKADFNVAIILKDGVVTLSKAGVYRLDCNPARIKVFHGNATVALGGESVMVATGKMLALEGASATAEKFDITETDSLDNWSQHRAEAMAMANLSGAKYSNDTYGRQPSTSSSTWVYNPYYGMYTYMPGMGTVCNPFYGYCYYSPYTAYQTFYAPSAYGNRGGGTGASNNAANNTYTNMRGATGLTGGIGANSGSGVAGAAPSGGATGAAGGGGMAGGHAGGGSVGGGGTGGHK